MSSVEKPDWLKLPAMLQHLFFEKAEAEAEKCKSRLISRSKKIAELEKLIRTEKIPEGEEWEDWRVAVVDGSNSPLTSERLGVRYGTYCSAYLIFDGRKQVDEGYSSGCFSQEQLGHPDIAQKTLSLLRFKLEREMALSCLKKDIDLLLMDGSFFGFRADAAVVNRERIDVDDYVMGVELTEDVRDLTLEILGTKKAVGLIKRTRSNVIDGWLINLHRDTSHCIEYNDKHILSSILKPGEWFAYEWLLGSPNRYNYYVQFRNLSRNQETASLDVNSLYRSAVTRTNKAIRDSLKCDWEKILATTRYFARCSSTAPPFEFEAHLDAQIRPVLSYFLGFHNPATGLPWPLDLVDSAATLPRGFTKEFVEEIEARMIKDGEVSDKLALLQYFSQLNPQKEED